VGPAGRISSSTTPGGPQLVHSSGSAMLIERRAVSKDKRFLISKVRNYVSPRSLLTAVVARMQQGQA
jgi:hypothetical protein